MAEFVAHPWRPEVKGSFGSSEDVRRRFPMKAANEEGFSAMTPLQRSRHLKMLKAVRKQNGFRI